MAKMVEAKCLKCGGNGSYAGLEHIENGVCFKCNGKGTVEITEQAYKARLRKLEESRKKAQGFMAFYLPATHNTYQDKAIIKSLGFKFDDLYGWHILKSVVDKEEATDFAIELGNEAREKGLLGVIGASAKTIEGEAETPKEMQHNVINVAIRQGSVY